MAQSNLIKTINSAVVGATCYSGSELVAEDVNFRLPSITRVTTEINAMGRMNVPTPLIEAMQTTVTYIGADRGLAALCTQGKQTLQFKWVQSVYDKLENDLKYVGMYALIEGFASTVPEISVTQGEAVTTDLTIETYKYLLQYGEEIVFDIDRTAPKFVVNGVDYAKDISALLTLTGGEAAQGVVTGGGLNVDYSPVTGNYDLGQFKNRF